MKLCTIRLRVNDKIYKHLKWVFSRFNKEEIQLIREDAEFISIQEYLKNELEEVENGTAEFISIEQLDNELENTIKKHEA